MRKRYAYDCFAVHRYTVPYAYIHLLRCDDPDGPTRNAPKCEMPHDSLEEERVFLTDHKRKDARACIQKQIYTATHSAVLCEAGHKLSSRRSGNPS